MPSGNYGLPKISDGGGCIDNTWIATAGAPPDGRDYHTAVWTGSEMIVWGGLGVYRHLSFNTGGRYNPSTDTWTATSTIQRALRRETYHTAVWTGTEMIVWGGEDGFSNCSTPAGDTIRERTVGSATSMTNAPSGRYSHNGGVDR